VRDALQYFATDEKPSLIGEHRKNERPVCATSHAT